MVHKKNKKLIIVGAGGHARVIIETALLQGYFIEGIVDINFRGKPENILDVPIIGGFKKLYNFSSLDCHVFIAIGDNKIRAKYFILAKKKGFFLPPLQHPWSKISQFAKINSGVFINMGAMINSLAIINNNTIINTGAIVDHETEIGENCHIAPGVKISGRCKIGDNTFIGIGSSVKDKIYIGNNCIIGAGSVVVSNIPDNSLAYGIPAKIQKKLI